MRNTLGILAVFALLLAMFGSGSVAHATPSWPEEVTGPTIAFRGMVNGGTVGVSGSFRNSFALHRSSDGGYVIAGKLSVGEGDLQTGTLAPVTYQSERARVSFAGGCNTLPFTTTTTLSVPFTGSDGSTFVETFQFVFEVRADQSVWVTISSI